MQTSYGDVLTFYLTAITFIFLYKKLNSCCIVSDGYVDCKIVTKNDHEIIVITNLTTNTFIQ